jgi:hypothetical protein
MSELRRQNRRTAGTLDHLTRSHNITLDAASVRELFAHRVCVRLAVLSAFVAGARVQCGRARPWGDLDLSHPERIPVISARI